MRKFHNRERKFFLQLIRNHSRWGSSKPDDVIIMRQPKKKPTSKGEIPYTMPKIKDHNILGVVTKEKQTKKFKKLAFLGDAYIEFIVSVFLAEKLPGVERKLIIKLRKNIVSNKNFTNISKEIGLLKHSSGLAVDSKKYADVFEAYFGGIATECCASTLFGNITSDVWNGWNKTSLFLLHFSKKMFENPELLARGQNSQCVNHHDFFDLKFEDKHRRITQLKNNQTNDLHTLFNTKTGQYNCKFCAERLHFLGSSALRFFLTKLFSDNLTKCDVGQIANMRDISLKDDVIISLEKKMPYYTTRTKSDNVKLNHVNVKQYLGYIVAKHYLESFNGNNHKSFQLGWIECQNYVKELYYNYMMHRWNNEIDK